MQSFDAHNHVDEDGKPAGGYVHAVGIEIEWQNGPLGRNEHRREPNGAFVETVIAAAKQRIEFYETTEFKCHANQVALGHLEMALRALNERTKDREERGVEGTHAV